MLDAPRTPIARTRCGGFTLVEVLVVVTIIGLLLGILVPVLGSARDSARAVACQANQRSIGQGIFAYAAQWDDAIPYGPQAHRIPDSLDFYPITGYITSLLSRLDGDPTAMGLALEDHLSDTPEVLFCPGTDQALTSDDQLERFYDGEQSQSSYWYRHGSVFDRDSGEARKQAGPPRLSALGTNREGGPVRALAMDTQFVAEPALSFFGVVTITHHETKRMNVLFADGSSDGFDNEDNRFTVDTSAPGFRIQDSPDEMLTRFERADAEYE